MIAPDDPRAPDVRALLDLHLAFAREHTPQLDVHALEVDDLLADDISFFTYRRGGELLAMGALKTLDASHAELKSMHTIASARGQGIGRAMVDQLVEVARHRGIRRVSIETGPQAAFAPARALYAAAGFEPCEPFGIYVDNTNSYCMTRELTEH
jgi:putative acetyltransferase